MTNSVATGSSIKDIRDMLTEQRWAYIKAAFAAPQCKKVSAHTRDDDEELVAQMHHSLSPMIPFLESKVREALSENKWSVEVGDYYGERGLCNVIRRIQDATDEYKDWLHKPSHAAFEAWARAHFACPRMRLIDYMHPEGSHTLELRWSPGTPDT